MKEPFPLVDDEEYNPQQLEEEQVYVVEIQKDEEGFGFSIHGGSDVGIPLRVMKIASGKAADRDRRLRVRTNPWYQLCYIVFCIAILLK